MRPPPSRPAARTSRRPAALRAAAALALLLAVTWTCWPIAGAGQPAAAPHSSAMGEAGRLLAPAAAPTAASSALPTVATLPRRAPPAAAPVRLTGSVQSHDQPMARAEVRVFAEPRAPSDRPLAVAVTNVVGAFTCDVASSAESFLLAVEGAGHAPATAPGVTAARPVLVKLWRVVSCSGVVRAAGSGVPLAGASVRVDDAGSAVTGADGRYELRATAMTGALRLVVQCPGHARGARTLRVHGADVRADFDLLPAVAVALEVVERDRGAPIASARVLAGDELLATSDAAGHCRLEVAIGEILALRVEAAGHCPLEWSWTADRVPAAALRLALQRAALVNGRVLGEDGAPVDGADVIAFLEPPAPLSRALSAEQLAAIGLPGSANDVPLAQRARTAPDGSFVLALPVGVAPRVRASRDGFVDAQSERLTLAGAGSPLQLELRLASAAAVLGKVTRNGRALRGRWVRWQHADGRRADRTFTDANGAYALRQCRSGAGEVIVEDLRGRELHRARVDLAPRTALVHDVACDELTAPIAGRVTSGGVPLAGVGLAATTGAAAVQRTYYAMSGDDGSYAIDCAAGCTYSVTLRTPAWHEDRFGIAAGARGVDFVVPELGVLPMQLVDAATGAGVAVPDGASPTFAWRRRGEPSFRAVRGAVDTAGRVHQTVAAGGIDVRVWFQEGGYEPCTLTDVRVAADGSGDRGAPVVVPLRRGAALELEVAAAGVAAPPPGGCVLLVLEQAQLGAVRGPFAPGDASSNQRFGGVHLWLEDPALLRQAPTFDAGGRAVLRGIAPGRYTLRAFPGDLVFEPEWFDVPPGGGKVALRWRRR